MPEQTPSEYFEITERLSLSNESLPIWYGLHRVTGDNGVTRQIAFRNSVYIEKSEEHFIIETDDRLIGVEHDIETANKRAYQAIREEADSIASLSGLEVVDRTSLGKRLESEIKR